MDILSGNLDDINFPEVVDGLIYAPGSINLKPFNRLSVDDFKNDFEINVLGAVKIIQKLLANLKSRKVLRLCFSVPWRQNWECLFTLRLRRAKMRWKVLQKVWRRNFRPVKIRVNAIAPSLTDTNLATQLLATPEKREASAKDIRCKE